MKKGRKSAVTILLIVIITCLSWSVSFADGETCTGGGEHQYEVTLISHATESKDGLRRYTCQICGYTYDEVIPSTGHEWSKWITDAEPTCTKAGHEYRKCSKNSSHIHYEYRTIPALGHNYKVQTTEPTKTAPGKKTYTCTRCGYSYTEQFGAATGTNTNETNNTNNNDTNGNGNKSNSNNDNAGLDANMNPEDNTASNFDDNAPSNDNSVTVPVGIEQNVPLDIADAFITFANILTVLLLALLIMPYIKALQWAANKRKEIKGTKQ